MPHLALASGRREKRDGYERSKLLTACIVMMSIASVAGRRHLRAMPPENGVAKPTRINSAKKCDCRNDIKISDVSPAIIRRRLALYGHARWRFQLVAARWRRKRAGMLTARGEISASRRQCTTQVGDAKYWLEPAAMTRTPSALIVFSLLSNMISRAARPGRRGEHDALGG